MSRQRTAALVITVALSVATPSFTYAATQPRNESKEMNRQDGDSVVARTIKNIKRVIKALEGPMIPPPVIPPIPDSLH